MTQTQFRWYPLLTVSGLFLLFMCACTSPASSSLPKNTEAKNSINTDSLKSTASGKHEQESCMPTITNGDFSKSDCEEGLVCTPDIYEKNQGSCRVPCAVLTEKNNVAKDSRACPAGRSCQIVTTLQLDIQGAFCLPKQRERDGLCQAVLDSESCASNRSCLPTSLSHSDDGISAKSFVCRNTCPFGKAEAGLACLPDETCMLASDNKTGICSLEITWASSKDFTPKFTGKNCNEISGHKFCNQSLLLGLDKPADVTCFTPQPSKNTGICLALCSVPALDMDGDGKISPEEDKKTLNCPVNYTCSGELARELGLSRMLPDMAKRKKSKSCDLTLCSAGKPCPDLCGPGDAECMPVQSSSNEKIGACGAPFGSCEPKQS